MAADPGYTVNITGLKLNDDPSVISGLVFATTALHTSPPGNYPITVSGGTATNYVLSYGSGTLTIDPLAITGWPSIPFHMADAKALFAPCVCPWRESGRRRHGCFRWMDRCMDPCVVCGLPCMTSPWIARTTKAFCPRRSAMTELCNLCGNIWRRT